MPPKRTGSKPAPREAPPAPSARIALYPGTFDTLTFGHIDLIERAGRLFDRLIVAVANNERKRPLFSVQERLDMLRKATAQWSNVECVSLEGLTVEFAQRCGARFIIRGLRAVSDFEYELQMAIMNRTVVPEVETIFLSPATKYIFLSSSLVKEVWRHGGDITPFVPGHVAEAFARLRSRPDATPASGASPGNAHPPAAPATRPRRRRRTA